MTEDLEQTSLFVLSGGEALCGMVGSKGVV